MSCLFLLGLTEDVLSDEQILTPFTADSSPASRAAASPADVVTPGPVLTPAGLTALLPKTTFWAFCPHDATHVIIKQNTSRLNLERNCSIFTEDA